MISRPEAETCESPRAISTAAPELASSFGVGRMPVELFYSYSHQDEELCIGLDAHLRSLQREGLICAWHDRRIGAGSDWEEQIDSHLKKADIIILIVSVDFLASDYCMDVELPYALKKQKSGEADVIPVIVRPVDWSRAPFAKLQVLPPGGKPIATLPNRDEAFKSVAAGIYDVVARRAKKQPAGPISTTPALPKKPRQKPHLMEAAVALLALLVCNALGYWGWTHWHREPSLRGGSSVEQQVDRGKALYRDKNYKAASAILKEAAENGSGEAADYLGIMSEFGLGVSPDCATAMKWFQSGSKLKSSSSINHLALLFEHGCGTKVNNDEAKRQFERAASLGSVEAIDNLGWMYVNNLGVETDYKKAMEYFRRAADGQDADAMNNIGWLYENGWGVSKPDFPEAMRWYKKSAAGNSTLGMNSLGWMYERGLGLAKPDYHQAMYWFNRAAELARGLGSSWAMNNIGDMYEKGRWGAPNKDQAIAWYQKSANNGFVLAQSNLERLGIKNTADKPCCP
jgi:TPR repeat protein